jgi:hypothetical protein
MPTNKIFYCTWRVKYLNYLRILIWQEILHLRLLNEVLALKKFLLCSDPQKVVSSIKLSLCMGIMLHKSDSQRACKGTV